MVNIICEQTVYEQQLYAINERLYASMLTNNILYYFSYL